MNEMRVNKDKFIESLEKLSVKGNILFDDNNDDIQVLMISKKILFEIDEEKNEVVIEEQNILTEMLADCGQNYDK